MQKFNIRETAEILIPDRVGRSSYLAGIGVIIVMLVIITLVIVKLPVSIPLYFTLPWGEARLAPKLMLYLLPGLSVVIAISNLAIGRLSASLSPLLPRTLAVATVVIVVMMMIALLGIIQSLL